MEQHRAWRLLKESIGSLGWRYYAFAAAVLVFALFSLLPAQLLKYFTAHLLQNDVPSFVTTLITFGAVVAAALWTSRAGSALCQEWLRITLESKLRMRILETLHSTGLVHLEAAQRGDWYSRVTSDLGRVEMFLTDVLPGQLRIFTILLGAGALFVVHSGPVALVPLLAALLLAFANFKVQAKLSPRLREMRELHGGVLQELIENFEGIRTIRSHGAENFVRTRFSRQLAHLRNRSLSVVRAVGALMGTNEFLTQSLITLCLVTVAIAVTGGKMGIDEALLYPFYLGMFCNAAIDLSRSAYDWNRFFTEGDRLADFLYSPKEAEQSSVPIAEARKIIACDISIGFEKRVLKHSVSFVLRRGELVVITGPSGCGKSTFLEVLAGLRPALSGTFEVQGLTRAIVSDTKELRSLSAYVEQRPYVFEGSLRDNLTLGAPAHESLLWSSLEEASIADFGRASGGLDFALWDRGENLSEGQRYRLALARAFLLNRPFLLLDEPFAAVDPLTASAMVDALNAKRSELGIVLVSHQIPEGLMVDREICFDGTEISETFFKEFPSQTGHMGLPL